MTTAREFLKTAGYEDTERNLCLLSDYLGNQTDYVSFPDANAVTMDGELLIECGNEPAAFQSWMKLIRLI